MSDEQMTNDPTAIEPEATQRLPQSPSGPPAPPSTPATPV